MRDGCGINSSSSSSSSSSRRRNNISTRSSVLLIPVCVVIMLVRVCIPHTHAHIRAHTQRRTASAARCCRVFVQSKQSFVRSLQQQFEKFNGTHSSVIIQHRVTITICTHTHTHAQSTEYRARKITRHDSLSLSGEGGPHPCLKNRAAAATATHSQGVVSCSTLLSVPFRSA